MGRLGPGVRHATLLHAAPQMDGKDYRAPGGRNNGRNETLRGARPARKK